MLINKPSKEQIELVIWVLVREGWLLRYHVTPAIESVCKQLDKDEKSET